MTIDNLLNRLEKVKSKGSGRWIACCPSHEDKSPSLSIAEVDDGRILIHCFAGCDSQSVLASIGLDMNDLFPERLGEFKRLRRPILPGAALSAVGLEALIVINSGNQLLSGQGLNFVEKERLSKAVARIQEAINLSGVDQ